jgi:glutamate/tyrosine decarboxylase-like PLP-dependent enzyme
MNDGAELQLSEEQMRELGYRVVDLLIEHTGSLPERNPSRRATRSAMERLFREDIPQAGRDPMQVLRQTERDVFGHIMHLDHPRFFAFIPSPSNFVSVMADALVSGFNIFAGTWLEAAAPTEIELVTIDWLRSACGLPDGAGGLFTSGGSIANLTAIATARHVILNGDMDGAVAYCSDQAHSSIARAFRILGFGSVQLQVLPSDEHFRLSPPALCDAVHRDRSAGLRPFCVIATAGTTNTGAVDPLRTLAALCREEGLWLHADGAYGAAAVFCERGRRLLDGIGDADSITLDPHKWLFQPYEIGCILVRNRNHLRETFHVLPEYLQDIAGPEEEVNFCDYGPQLTRSFRALKLWMSLQVFGAEAFAKAVQRGFDLAELAESIIRGLEGWRVVTSAHMGVVTFQACPEGYDKGEVNEHNQALVEAILDDGYAMLASTRLRGQTVLRMCSINPRTTPDDVRSTIERLNSLSRKLQKRRKIKPA